MKNILITTFFLLFILCIIRNVKGQENGCGIERWDVKTLTDSDTNKINWSDTLQTTIIEQRKLTPIKKGKNVPRAKNECQLAQIEAYIIGYKLESDFDIHIVIADDKGNTMIAEIPDPECNEVKNCSHYKDILAIKDWFTKTFNPKKAYKKIGDSDQEKFIITGVLFSDFIHGQTGVAPSGRELHPVLSIIKK